MTKTVIIISATVAGAAAIGVGIWLLIKKMHKKRHDKTDSEEEKCVEEIHCESGNEWDSYINYASTYSPTAKNNADKETLSDYIFGHADGTAVEMEEQNSETEESSNDGILAHSEELAKAIEDDMYSTIDEQYPVDDDYEIPFYDDNVSYGYDPDDECETDTDGEYDPEDEADSYYNAMDREFLEITDSGRKRLPGCEDYSPEEYIDFLKFKTVRDFRTLHPERNDLTDEEIIAEQRRYNMSNEVYDSKSMTDAEIDALLCCNNSKKYRPLIEVVDETEWDRYYAEHINDFDVLQCDFYCGDQTLLIFNPMTQKYDVVESPFESLGGNVVSYLTRHPDETVFVKDQEACNMWEIRTVDDNWDY